MLDVLAVTSTDENGHQQIQTLDGHGRLVKRTKMKDTTPILTQYTRDALGRIVHVIDPALNTWGYGYDGLSRRTGVKDPDLGNWAYFYDNASHLIRQVDAKLNNTVLSYDAMGRVVTKAVTGPTITTETTTNTYDESRTTYFNRGQLTTALRVVPVSGTMPAVNVSRQYNYDLAGRLAQENHLAINGQTRTLAYEYWQDGSVKRKQLATPALGLDPGGTWTGQYLYDLAGRLASIDNANTASATEPAMFIQAAAYNARGQTTSITYGNGITTTFKKGDASLYFNDHQSYNDVVRGIRIAAIPNLGSPEARVFGLFRQ